jgi:hemoglobin/transferrin/lactoferrin receptor protein
MGRRVNKSVVQRLGTKVLTAALLGSTCVYALSLSTAFQAQAQTARQVSFNIPAGSLSSALANFGRQAGMQVTYQPQIASAKQAPAVSGMMTPQDALSRLLAGSGISHRFTGSNTVALAAQSAAAQAPLAADGTTLLDTITVTGGAGVVGAEAPYQTAAPTNYISSETIERFRGSSPADIFRGTPGVMSGEARNGAGSVDVNIRGMQGMGRVATTIDGAENSVTVYQGYQGLSNRTYIDPDLIAGIDINKGSDASSRGIAGNVAIRTLDADDIVKVGDNWGMRVKGEYGSNSSSPHAGAKGGYAWPYSPSDVPEVVGSPDGMNRPSFLTPTNGSASIVAAIKEENYDFFAGYAYRKRGNYHAGKHGPSADPVNIGPARTCNTSGSWCQNWPEYI